MLAVIKTSSELAGRASGPMMCVSHGKERQDVGETIERAKVTMA